MNLVHVGQKKNINTVVEDYKKETKIIVTRIVKIIKPIINFFDINNY